MKKFLIRLGLSVLIFGGLFLIAGAFNAGAALLTVAFGEGPALVLLSLFGLGIVYWGFFSKP